MVRRSMPDDPALGVDFGTRTSRAAVRRDGGTRLLSGWIGEETVESTVTHRRGDDTRRGVRDPRRAQHHPSNRGVEAVHHGERRPDGGGRGRTTGRRRRGRRDRPPRPRPAPGHHRGGVGTATDRGDCSGRRRRGPVVGRPRDGLDSRRGRALRGRDRRAARETPRPDGARGVAAPVAAGPSAAVTRRGSRRTWSDRRGRRRRRTPR